MRPGALSCLALVLLASMPAAAIAQDTDAEAAFRSRVSWSHHDGQVTLQKRPKYVYLVGDRKGATLFDDGTACDCDKPFGFRCEKLCRLREKLVIFEVRPTLGFLSIQGGKCQDKLCLPDTCPTDGLCPPDETLPLPELETGTEGKQSRLTWIRSRESVRLTSKSHDSVFWLLEDARARLLFPGETLTVTAPASVYEMDCVGQFAPDFTPASQLEGGCSLQPCRNRPMTEGLCSPSESP